MRHRGAAAWVSVIIGGAPHGLATACRLARRLDIRRITVLE
jgi:2-polyprenyl-6-methoxyphenol hydroxylase-like FAD-dependent oxidoreductase